MVKFISALSVKYRFCGNVDLSDQSEKISDQSLSIMFHMIAGLGLDSVSPTPSLGLVLVSAPKSFGLVLVSIHFGLGLVFVLG